MDTLVTAAAITAVGATAGAWFGLRGKRESERAAERAAELAGSADVRKAEIASTDGTNARLWERVEALEKKLDDRTTTYEARMAAQDERNNQLSQDNDDLARKLRDAQARIAELEAEVAQLKAQQVQP